MSERHLTILEVSQKQAYIFQSNKLRDNVNNSEVIALIMSADYMEKTIGDTKIFNEKDNLVYSGGGHTVLEFPSGEQAVKFTRLLTKAIKRDYPGIEVFAKTVKYEDEKTPADNLKILTEELETKKSVRRAAFHQGSFGVEETDTNSKEPVRIPTDKENAKIISRIDEELPIGEYKQVNKFEELGGTKNESNFIAVVHIDGNAMGKRVEKIQQKLGELDWEGYKEKLREFSESVDEDFKAAYKEMAEYVADNIRNEKLKDLDLADNHFPVRRIITAGDDICFVTEGRIGIECAAAFINLLNKKTNSADHENYAACAGVAIVHQKYPFYKAYELAEMLCSNAKKRGAALSSDDTGSDISMIDWHIEFGEIKDTLEDIRSEYINADNNSMIGRPYIVSAEDSVKNKESAPGYNDARHDNTVIAQQLWYDDVRSLICRLQDDESCARGSLKELRSVLKLGEAETEHFLKFHKIDELVKWDLHENRRVLFDAIELIDTFAGLGDKEGLH